MPDRATYRAHITDAVKNRDPIRFAQCIDWLRFERGLTYDGSFKVFNKITGVSRDDFEELCQIADEVSGAS